MISENTTSKYYSACGLYRRLRAVDTRSEGGHTPPRWQPVDYTSISVKLLSASYPDSEGRNRPVVPFESGPVQQIVLRKRIPIRSHSPTTSEYPDRSVIQLLSRDSVPSFDCRWARNFSRQWLVKKPNSVHLGPYMGNLSMRLVSSFSIRERFPHLARVRTTLAGLCPGSVDSVGESLVSAPHSF